jgi:hypothetical protein
VKIHNYTSSAESLSLLRAVPRKNTRGLCSQGRVKMALGTRMIQYTEPTKDKWTTDSGPLGRTVRK